MEDEDEKVALRFVIPTGESELSVSDGMITAFQLCSEQGFEPSWIKENKLLELSPTKTDVFVFDPFEGPGFEHLTKSNKFKCTVVGPMCLIPCVEENSPIPNLPYPMYSTAMKGLWITISGFPKDEKAEIQTLIERMSGMYSPVLHDGVTHIISSKVNSEKYKVAVKIPIPAMTKEWVYEVWKACKRGTVSAVDSRFLQYICPALLGLTVTVSQLNKVDRNAIKKKIETHGGYFLPELTMDKTDILICVSGEGPKFQFAQKWKIPCLNPQWILHSVDKGSALPMDEYRVERESNKASTPTKEDTTVTGLEEVSMCSTILNPNDSAVVSRVDETANSTVLGIFTPPVQGKVTQDWLAELDLARVKKSGSFLDNLKIYLSGFVEKDQVLLTRVLKYAGATRLAQLVDSVTHVVHAVARNVEPETSRLIKDLGLSPYSVSLEWIVESMKRGQKVSETSYPFPPTEIKDGNPAEKTFRSPQQIPMGSVEIDKMEDNILDQYKPNQTEGDRTMTQDMSSKIDPFFSNLKFALVGLSAEIEQDLTEWIHEVGGEIVFSDYTGTVDFLISTIAGCSTRFKYKEHLNYLWVEDTLDIGRMLAREYYHLPLRKKIKGSPLNGIVTCVSGYTGRERVYINTIIELLGGNPQEMFAKKDNKEKNVKASTHLLCPLAEGQKYLAALKWGLPVITKDWLMACLKESNFISEQPFLVGDASAVTKGKPLPSQDIQDDTLQDPQDDTVHEARDDTVHEAQDDTVHEARDDTVHEAQDDTVHKPENDTVLEDDVLQDIDQNQSAASSGTRRRTSQLRKSGGRRDSLDNSEIILKDRGGSRMEVDEGTPVSSRTKDIRKPEHIAFDRLKISTTPGVKPSSPATPGVGRVRGAPMDYSPLPSQPWPDTQAPITPASGTKRKRGDGYGYLNMPTPDTPYGQHMGANPSPTTRKYFKKRSEDLKRFADNYQTSHKEEIERERKALEKYSEDIKTKPKHQPRQNFMKILEEKYAKLEKKQEGLQEAEIDDSERESVAKKPRSSGDEGKETSDQEMTDDSANKILAGVTVYIAKKLVQMSQEIEEMVGEMGGSVSSSLDSSVTHLIFQGKTNDLTKEFRQAREGGKCIVSPVWVHICRDEGRRVDESAFPHTYNPTTSLSFIEPQRGSRLKQKEKLAKPVFQDDENSNSMDEGINKTETERSKLIQETPVDSYKKSLKSLESLVEEMKNSPSVSIASSSKQKPMQLDMSEDKTRITTPQTKECKEVESQVLWVDPEEERNRKELAHKLSLETQEISGFSENMTAEMDSGIHKVFSFSGVEENQICSAVEKLGGEVSKKGTYDSSATHMIAGKVNRSEKNLGCIAAGSWILHPSYIKDSLAAGFWLQEEAYEWGNPSSDFLDLTSASIESRMSVAARRWRMARERGKGKVFSGMKAHIAVPSQKQGSFARLIVAGGGKIIDLLSETTMMEISHIFTESKYFPTIQKMLPCISEFCIPVLQPVYLSEYLSNEKHPVVENYMLEEYKPCWEKNKRSRVTTDTPTSLPKKSRL